MTSTPLVEGSNTESHNGVHEDLERIYTVITTPEERVVMKPFKSLFDEINTALVGHHLDPGSTAFRNLCMRWCRRAHEATRLLPRHLVIDCGCVVLNVWFRWALRYFSDQVASNCRRIVEAFKERNDTCRALLECDEVVDVVTLSHDEVIQCVVDDADALYPLYLCDDEQPFHILRGALDDVVQIHALLDLLCTLGQQLSHHLGVHRADVKTIMSNALANLVTRPWIRRWVLLLVGAIHIHSPITAWMHHEDSLFQQWKMTNHRYVAPLENAFGALVKLTQRIFDDETRMTFVVIVAMLVLKEQMVRHVCPLAEWAVQMSTGGAVNEEDEWEDVKVDGDVSGVSDTDDAIPRAYQFLVELNDHVLKNLSFMSEWLCVGTAIREDLYEARTLEGRFLVLIFSFFIDPAIITSFDDPQLRSSFLFRLLELASLRVLERYLRSGENDVSPMCVSGDGGEEDDEGSAESADGSPTLESIFPFFSITNNTLLRTITQESDESDTGADMSTSEDSNPGEAKYYTDCRPDCQESDSDLHMLKTVFEFRQRILNANIRNYSQWHRLSLNSRPYDVWRVVLYTMGSLVVHSVETLLLETYSTATLVPSMDHDDDSVEQAQMIVSAGSHEEQRKRKEVRILSLIKVATQMARKLKILFEDSPYRRSYVVYFGRSYLVCFGMMNILASMSSVELDMYLCSITDAIHNYYLRIGGYSTWTREERDGVMQDASTHIKSHGAIAQLSHMDSLGDVGFEKRLDDFNTIHETDILNQECFLHGYELVALHTGFDNLLVLRKQMMETNPEWLRDDSSCCDSFIRIHDFEQLQSMLDLPIPSDQRGVFLRYMDAALRVRLLYRPLSTVLKHTTKARGTLSSHNSRTVSIRLLDACYWGFHPSTYFLMTQIATCASSSARPTTPQAQPSSDAEELPFPADLAAALVDYTHEYQQQKHHEQRQLHWCRNYAYTTFVLYYPQDGGLPTTIHGTLHLQRLFVALTGYKRVGVTWSRLAARAHVSVKELKQQLQKCVKLGLLVCVGKDDEGEEGHGVEYVAMNYDYVRPVESTDGVIEVWPECPRLVRDMVVERGTTKATSDAVRVEQLAPTVMSIMKQKKRVSYSELVDLVRAAVQTRFVPTPAMMKSCVEGLIDRKYLQRAVEEDSSHLASSVVVLEYMP